MPLMHPDRLFPVHAEVRAIARDLYAGVRELPILSPHGHTDPAWFAGNEPFSDATSLLLEPDHYLFRMLYSQGVPLDALGIPRADGGRAEVDPRAAWRLLAQHWHLFRGTPSQLWMDHLFEVVFGIEEALGPATADASFDRIGELLASDAFRPRALFERFNIEALATTESPLDELRHHDAIRASGWGGRVITAFRPDPVVDPEFEGFAASLEHLGELTGENTGSWAGYLAALRNRREYFMQRGATSTDHGHPSARTENLDPGSAQKLFDIVACGDASAAEAEVFRGQMLTEMARMSLDDGLVMQIHPGSFRNHNQWLFQNYGRDKGADIPMATNYVRDLKPLLDAFGNDRRLSLIVFTLDETSYARELAPLAGHYPAMKLGPSWWFHDSPEGMRRFRRQVTETAGLYNTVGFNDDTRAFLSIPARHDLCRRIDCGWLAEMVAEHRMSLDAARELAPQLAYQLAKDAYKL
jgi:glucuronate isomerase